MNLHDLLPLPYTEEALDVVEKGLLRVGQGRDVAKPGHVCAGRRVVAVKGLEPLTPWL